MRKWVLVAAWSLMLSPALAANPWAAMSKGDLQAMHDLIAANHPGAVDLENPHFRDWLENGFVQAMTKADEARSIDDYERTLHFYQDGFQDGHVGVWFSVNPDQLSWAGFILYATDATDVQVVAAEPGSGVKAGDRLLSCDGKGIDALLAERTDAFYWNAAVPHLRYAPINYLFRQDAQDHLTELSACTFSSGQVTLKWRNGDYAAVMAKYDAALATSNEPGLRQIDGVWLLSLPTFYYPTDADIAKMQGIISQVEAKAAVLRNATLVIDVRGNTGGSSRWGEMIAAALWGKAWVERIKEQQDETVDWRASDDNLAQVDWIIEYVRKQSGNNTETLRRLSAMRQAMAVALKNHRSLVRESEPAHSPSAPLPPNPVKGRVFFLTDRSCGSACLDFADLMRQLPGVTQVGQPTSADSVYLEANLKPLPSGIAMFEYPMKVYRHRLRKNNEWYEPKVLWPYGPMVDDAAIIRWIRTLK